jgi:drug/metabolite transporter (DMT)-like permease
VSATARRDAITATLLMVASAGMFGMMAIAIRYASAELHPFEIAFFRNLFGFMFALPLLLRTGFGLLRTDKLRLYFVRCAIGMVSMLCGFWAIVNLPLAQAVSLSYSTPLFVTIGAVLVLHEVVRARRWSAVLIGFVGVLIIVRPFGDSFTAGSLVAVTAAVFSAAVAISIKFLSRTEHPDAIVLYTSMLWVPMSLVPALFYWSWPSATGWAWLVLTGFFGTAGHMCWTRAFRLGDASALTPLSFVQLPIVAVLAWLLFDEVLDRWTALGAAVIFAANFYIAHREARLARGAVTDRDIGSDNPPTAR